MTGGGRKRGRTSEGVDNGRRDLAGDVAVLGPGGGEPR